METKAKSSSVPWSLWRVESFSFRQTVCLSLFYSYRSFVIDDADRSLSSFLFFSLLSLPSSCWAVCPLSFWLPPLSSFLLCLPVAAPHRSTAPPSHFVVGPWKDRPDQTDNCPHSCVNAKVTSSSCVVLIGVHGIGRTRGRFPCFDECVRQGKKKAFHSIADRLIPLAVFSGRTDRDRVSALVVVEIILFCFFPSASPAGEGKVAVLSVGFFLP
mmetsp:Transcript_14362/g.28886  ORF Transcript_14362/g.28886 Transcript_14362/m.28886 type:complete len:214 (+) Transcript_14362:2225-2866(+)